MSVRNVGKWRRIERREAKEGKVDWRSRRPFRLFLCSHLPSCPSFRYAQSGFSKLTFAPTVTSILRFFRTTLSYQRTLGMRISHRRKKSWYRALLFPSSLLLSISSAALGRLLISRRCQLPEMNHRSCVRACVRVDFRLAQVYVRARTRAAYRELGM